MRVSVSDIALACHSVVASNIILTLSMIWLNLYYLETYDKIDEDDEDALSSESEGEHSTNVGHSIYFR